MTQSRSLLTTLAVGVFVAACSSPATTAPGSSTGGGPGATAGPGATQTGGGPGSSQDVTAGSAFSTAANALNALDSYRFNVRITSSSNGTFGSEGTTAFTGTVVHKPDEEQQFDEVVTDATGTVTSELHFVIIGANAWTKETASGAYTAVPAAAVTPMTAAFAAFRPEQLFGTAFGTLGSDYHLVGTETKNGVNCQHFSGDESIGTFFSALSGTSGSWQSDVWLAADGGYLVSSNVSAAAATATSAGSFSISVDITNVNDPANKLTPPS
ncbi:MAG: hypothetical protein HY263_02975 [Chloroflexi bacterium]|nr:hypothetical protein [Chloroflexota bacterium]